MPGIIILTDDGHFYSITVYGTCIGKITNTETGMRTTVPGTVRRTRSGILRGRSPEVADKTHSWQDAIVSNAGSIIVVTDTNGIIRVFNPEAVHATGYSADEILGKATPVLLHDHKELEIFRRELKEQHDITAKNDFHIFIEKAKLNRHRGVECTLIKKDGSRLPVLLSVTELYDRYGNEDGFLGVAIDISDRKKAEEDLKRALEKEKELGEMKSRFISMASHEFRTPLSTVLSSAYLIEKYNKAEDQPQRTIHLNRIVSAVSMLTSILNDFMSTGRIEEGRIKVRKTEVHISDWMFIAIREMEGLLKKGQHILYHHSGEAMLETDAALLKQMLINLVSNAAKFSPTDTKISIRTKRTSRDFLLAVKDEGIGISKEDQRHLMERFFRSASVDHIQGTGLGLHIVSRYAELLGGKIHFRSSPGKGSTFMVSIPVIVSC